MEDARVARLATVRPEGHVDVVPIVFAFSDGRIVSAVDHKPKRTQHLQRLDNVAAHPEVTLLVDHYDDTDWSALWWVRVRGLATVLTLGARYDAAIDALVERYPQYARERPGGAVLSIDPVEWVGWSAGTVV